jgi:hypothetical protein
MIFKDYKKLVNPIECYIQICLNICGRKLTIIKVVWNLRKKQKRILIIALIILIFGIVATLITIPLVKNNNEKRTLKDKLENLEIPYTGESDISLPITLDEYVITWESSHPDIVSELGKIISYPNSDTTVKLKATIIGSRTKVERIFHFLIKK